MIFETTIKCDKCGNTHEHITQSFEYKYSSYFTTYCETCNNITFGTTIRNSEINVEQCYRELDHIFKHLTKKELKHIRNTIQDKIEEKIRVSLLRARGT